MEECSVIKNIPKDTRYFHYYNANPKGIRAADCAIRALSLALNQTWEDTLQGLTEVALKCKRDPTETDTIAKYLNQKGWIKEPQPKHLDGTKYTGKQFIDARLESRVIICNIGAQHMSVITGGKFYDTWDPSDYTVGNYWSFNEQT